MINDRFLLRKPYLENDHSSKGRNTVTIKRNHLDEFLYPERHLIKRTTNEDLKKPHPQGSESEGESRASIPFLPGATAKEESQPSGGGLPSLPGLPDMSGADSNTPTAVIGGFSLLIMPMPGLTVSNFGSALQTGQQMSQLMPGLSSLAG